MTNLIIIGTGDFAEVAYDLLEETNLYNIIGFGVEKAFQKEDTFCKKPVYLIEDLRLVDSNSRCQIFIAIGPNKINSTRERIYKEFKNLGYLFIKYIHKSAIVSQSSSIGENCMIFPNVIIEPFAKVGNNCIIWSSSVLCHHSTLEDNCFVAPGVKISGRTHVGRNCFLGINSTIREKVVVSEYCIIGAGVLIKKDTVKNAVYSEKGTPIVSLNSLEINL